MSTKSTKTTQGRYAWPEPGTWTKGGVMKAHYSCHACGRQVAYHVSMSGSAWRHTDNSSVRCDWKAKP